MGLGNYAKAINAAIILVLGVLVTGLEDGSLTTVEIVMLVIAALRGVIAIGVKPEWGKFGIYLPLLLTALIGALTQLITALQDGADGVSPAEWASIAVVFFTAVASTYATPNAKKSDALKNLSNAT